MKFGFSSRVLAVLAGTLVCGTKMSLADTETAPSAASTPTEPATTASAPTEPAESAPASAEVMLRRYERALKAQKLGPAEPLGRARLQQELAKAEAKLADGRTGEVIDEVTSLVESERFLPFEASAEGRGLRYYLGEALGRAGVYALARPQFSKLLAKGAGDVWFRRAVRSLVDFGLASDAPAPFLEILSKVRASLPAELQGDVAYLRGRVLEREGKRNAAFHEYQRVPPEARFWAQATYLSGLIAVGQGRLKAGEQLFCKVAEPKRTPRTAAKFGGSDFFRVRDLARLGLGRVAHEQYRFDDARYYYFLVPKDSEHLPEALYETATTRYEAKDYKGARESLDELRALERPHAYSDEAWILDAYVDLALCQFPRADASLQQFLKRYEPIRNAAKRLLADPGAMRRLAEAVERGADPGAAGLGVPSETARALGSLLRVDLGYGRALRRSAELEYQLRGLRSAMQALDEARRTLVTPGEMKPSNTGGARPLEPSNSRSVGDFDKVRRVEGELEEVRRLLREAALTSQKASERSALEEQLRLLELRFRAETARAKAAEQVGVGGDSLLDLMALDRERASMEYARAEKLRDEVRAEQVKFAKAALTRLDLRLSRLLARARLGRIETVLGKKRALEMEIEALAQGLLPHTIVDSLDAARYLADDEEYWPFDGEDWEDEYVGGEGLE